MISDYKGHYLFNRDSIKSFAPNTIGVYYCGRENRLNGTLIPYYIGRAKGNGVTIKSRLLDHLSHSDWQDVLHFGYRICQMPQEATEFESTEITRWQPKYNQQGKSFWERINRIYHSKYQS